MGAFDKIAQAVSKSKRKLFDYSISLSGTESQVVLLKLSLNKYKDEEVTISDSFITSVVIDIPGEIPIDRLRKDVTQAPATTQSVFFYDVLPIQIYSKFEDNIERGDILISKIQMDNDVYFMVLEVANTLGNLLGRNIIYKKQDAAPVTKALPDEVKEILSNYKLI